MGLKREKRTQYWKMAENSSVSCSGRCHIATQHQVSVINSSFPTLDKTLVDSNKEKKRKGEQAEEKPDLFTHKVSMSHRIDGHGMKHEYTLLSSIYLLKIKLGWTLVFCLFCVVFLLCVVFCFCYVFWLDICAEKWELKSEYLNTDTYLIFVIFLHSRNLRPRNFPLNLNSRQNCA